MTPPARLGHARLQAMTDHLSERDRTVLKTIYEHRFLTTRQVTEFCFTDKPTATAALRAAHRVLRKLNDLSLIDSLQRRIGGVRAGSGGSIWSVTEAGHRLLHLNTAATDDQPRARFREPSQTFLEHTLAVAAVHLALRHVVDSTAGTKQPVQLSRLEFEPACWRSYLSPATAELRLKPDLAAVSETGDFEDHWFIEVDRATEPPSRIVRKCLQYQQYYRTGREQHLHGVFPIVLWIVPNTARQTQLHDRIQQDATLDARLFRVITLDQLPALLISTPTASPKGGTHP